MLETVLRTSFLENFHIIFHFLNMFKSDSHLVILCVEIPMIVRAVNDVISVFNIVTLSTSQGVV